MYNADKAIVTGVAIVAIVAIGIALTLQTQPKPVVPPDPSAVCQELGATAGFETSVTKDGTCWFHVEEGLVLPYEMALELLKFQKEAEYTYKLGQLGD